VVVLNSDAGAFFGITFRGGTGLGLVISQRLIRLIGGQITVGSEVDTGTTFRCSILRPVSRTRTPARPVRMPRQTRVADRPFGPANPDAALDRMRRVLARSS